MRIPAPITINGISGTPDHIDDFRDALLNLEDQLYPNGYPNKEAAETIRTDLIGQMLHAVAVADYHNTAVSLVRAYLSAGRKAHAAKYAAGAAYDDLTARTTTAWHAAHHRYIVAIHAAETAYAELAEAATHLAAHHTNNWSGMVASFYDQLVTPDQRLDRDALDHIASQPSADHELTLFREQHRGNLHLLAYTITGGIPAGYEADPVPTADTETARSNW